MVKYCIECGTKLDDSALYCTNCGTKNDFQPNSKINAYKEHLKKLAGKEQRFLTLAG